MCEYLIDNIFDMLGNVFFNIYPVFVPLFVPGRLKTGAANGKRKEASSIL
jgi:hypothetical protein